MARFLGWQDSGRCASLDAGGLQLRLQSHCKAHDPFWKRCRMRTSPSRMRVNAVAQASPARLTAPPKLAPLVRSKHNLATQFRARLGTPTFRN